MTANDASGIWLDVVDEVALTGSRQLPAWALPSALARPDQEVLDGCVRTMPRPLVFFVSERQGASRVGP